MYWSLVLFAFKEAVEDDARDAGRNRYNENAISQRNQSDGGSLSGIDKHPGLIQSSFKKLLESNSWVINALKAVCF